LLDVAVIGACSENRGGWRYCRFKSNHATASSALRASSATMSLNLSCFLMMNKDLLFDMEAL
jgi:hypothetical protein